MFNYNKKDFTSDQEVRWCAGCGDHAILNSLMMALTKIGRKKEDIVFVSGIGCSSRLPYYLNTYGLHTIHGRAPAIASGLKIQNPNLSVWIITGDGDGLSIGGNHFIHLLRRNVDVNIILFNNEIYGLTKGQYSPTSKTGIVTKSTPYGSLDRSFSPVSLALGVGATFVAKTIDNDPKHLIEMFTEAECHRGTSFIEILQNCVIFNNKTHDEFTNIKTRQDNLIYLKDKSPLRYGKKRNKGIRWKDLRPSVISAGEGDFYEDSFEALLSWHDIDNKNMANVLCNMHHPLPVGVIYKTDDHVYDREINEQLETIQKEKGKGNMQEFLRSGDTWEVD